MVSIYLICFIDAQPVSFLDADILQNVLRALGFIFLKLIFKFIIFPNNKKKGCMQSVSCPLSSYEPSDQNSCTKFGKKLECEPSNQAQQCT